ncbi:MAG TPA: acetate--CoA ligase family protein [Acidobacteriota bacterium]|nr:acetate--CoA ligase family protein [Acidobacteriota bacterium]
MDLRRLLSPRSVAFVGGRIAEMTIRRCQQLGFAGEMMPVHPDRQSVAGLRCYPTLESLPQVPDAAYVGVNRRLTIDIVARLSAMGAGGCVCYAAGFAEIGDGGEEFQDRLVEAAGHMPLVGPNTFGFLNLLEDCALWPYLFGGGHVDEGVALISQSGNIAMNLTMNQRSVRFTHVIGTGNQAVLGPGDYLDALLDDSRVRAVGMYLEGLDDVDGLSRAASRALEQRVPVVVLKVGRTEAAAERASTHTSSIVGSDTLVDAYFERLGIVRVGSLTQLLETLKLFDVSGPLRGNDLVTLSCSGGEAAILADLTDEHGLRTSPFSQAQRRELESESANYVTVSNPFDYNTSIWGDAAAQERCFTISMSGEHDAAVLVYDHPTVQAAEVDEWIIALDAFIAAQQATGMRAFVVCTITELLPEPLRERLIAHGITPLQGLDDALFALAAAAAYEHRRGQLPRAVDPTDGVPVDAVVLDEWESKQRLSAYGLVPPAGEVGSASEAAQIADRIGYPVVIKALGAELAHKSELGAVLVGLHSEAEVVAGVAAIAESITGHGARSERFLVERMVEGAVAELLVGVKRDPQFGPALVIGTGGTLVELLADTVALLLPTERQAVEAAVSSLKVSRLLDGFRGAPAGDRGAAIDAIVSVADFAADHWDTLVELDINPLMVLPAGGGVVVADALIRISLQESELGATT